MHSVYINATGTFLPGNKIFNDEIEHYIGMINDIPSRYRKLVLKQNKIKSRYYALDSQGNSLHSNHEMAAKAIFNALESSEINKKNIEFLATATSLGDSFLPGLASHVHAELGIPPIEISSLQSVCSSAMMAIKTAFLQLKSGEHVCSAVSGSEFCSRYFKPGFYSPNQNLSLNEDFLRFTLSDGAGAFILENRPNQHNLSLKIHWIHIQSFADRFKTSMIAGGQHLDDNFSFWGDEKSVQEALNKQLLCLSQDFEEMKKMIPIWVGHYLNLIDQNKIIPDEIDYFCSHYSSHSLREEAIALLEKTNAMIDEDKWFSNLYDKGNTGSASIFIILDELLKTKNLYHGQKILCHVPESGRCINGFMLLEVWDQK